MGKYTEAQIELMDETIEKLLNLQDCTDIFDYHTKDLNRVKNRINSAIDSAEEVTA